MAGDDDTAAPCGGSFGGDKVFGCEAGGNVDGAESICVGVRADAADVEDGGRGKYIL